MLNARQLAFVSAYTGNAAEAAKAAGYSDKTAKQQGSRLLTNVDVAAAIADRGQHRLDRLEVKSEDVLRELLRIGLSDVGSAFDENGALLPLAKMPLDVRRAIASVETEELKVEGVSVGTIRKLKFWDKNKALESLGRHLKLFTDKVEHSGKVTLAELLSEVDEKP